MYPKILHNYLSIKAFEVNTVMGGISLAPFDSPWNAWNCKFICPMYQISTAGKKFLFHFHSMCDVREQTENSWSINIYFFFSLCFCKLFVYNF